LGLLAQSTRGKLFPKDFSWGVASAAYQVEGAWNIDGKGPNIWDYFSAIPNRTYEGETGQVADDFYHHYPDDIKIMQNLGIKNFRISLAWSRLLPNGTVDTPNPAGVQFYNDLINACLAADIEPWVTLYHWDLPQAFNDFSANGTWLNPDIVNKFNDYADFAFQSFGDRVKHWLTFNEISSFTWFGYGHGTEAPGRCGPDFGDWCTSIGGGGNSSTEPYIAAHHALLSHALAVQTYRTKYQKAQNGTIGLTMAVNMAYPWDSTNQDDIAAVDTDLIFQMGWFADPLVFGKYPDIMIEYVGDRLPAFTEDQSELIKGSFDFLGLNHYTSHYVQHTGIPGFNYGNDSRLIQNSTDVHGHLIGPVAESSWLNVYPKGMKDLLKWADTRYSHPTFYIFENGVSVPNENNMPINEAQNDTFRIGFLKGYITNLILAVLEDGVDVRGYFIWSILDNYSWESGYRIRYGLLYVDYNNNLTRYIKDSANWYSDFIKIMSDEHYLENIEAFVAVGHHELECLFQ